MIVYEMYAKLFSSIYQGTLRGDTLGLVVFTNLLAHADAKGWVDIHPKAIADETGLTMDQVLATLLVLESPDPESRSPEEEGRRIIRLDEHRDWGWTIVNHGKYRAIRNEDDRREQNRLAQERWRNKRKQNKPPSAEHKPPSAESAQAEAEAVTTKDIRPPVRKKTCRRASRFDPTMVGEDWLSYCKQKRPDLSPTKVMEDFTDYWKAKAGPNALKLDWLAAWRYWVRNQRTGKDSGQTALDYLNARGDKDVS